MPTKTPKAEKAPRTRKKAEAPAAPETLGQALTPKKTRGEVQLVPIDEQATPGLAIDEPERVAEVLPAEPKPEGAPAATHPVSLRVEVTRNSMRFLDGDQDIPEEEARALLSESVLEGLDAAQRRMAEGERTSPPDRLTIQPQLAPAPNDNTRLTCPKCEQPSGWTVHDLRLYRATAPIVCGACGRTSEAQELRAKIAPDNRPE